MDLRAVKAATQSELAQCAVALATNAQALVADAELLAAAGCSGRAYACAVRAVEESGQGMTLATLACLPESFRHQAPLRRMLEWHQMKLARGLLATVLPFGSVGSRIAAMPAGELARTCATSRPPTSPTASGALACMWTWRLAAGSANRRRSPRRGICRRPRK
jgi:AbiV family abortive infection protein